MKKTFAINILNELFLQQTDVHTAECGSGRSCVPDVFSAFNGKVVLVSYCGALGLACLDEFKPSLFATLTGGAQQIIVNLEHTTQLSRSTLGALVDFASTVLGRGKDMYLFKPPASLEQSLVELQLTSFFKILRNEEALVNILPDD